MKETGSEIRVIGDPILRKKAKAVKVVTPYHQELLSKMARQMYDAQGIGLAAPQVGVGEALIVVDIGSCLYKLVNPKITKRQGRQSMEEGCLSVPGVSIKVKRSKKITVCALTDEAKPVKIDAEDFLACVFQHEIDHLHGKLIIDYATLLDKITLKRKLKTVTARNGNEKLPKSRREAEKL
jgi:peptide deformylase